jgi:hypothetical protein
VGVAAGDPHHWLWPGDLPGGRLPGQSGVGSLAIYAAIAFYLNTATVRDAFLSRSDVLASHDSSYEPGPVDGVQS